MKTRFALAMVSGLTASCLSTAWSFQLTATESLANYDRRFESASGSPAVWAPAQAQAVASLKSRVPGVAVSRDRVLGTPQMITSTRGFLTGPGGAGLAVSEASLAAIPAGDEQRIIKAFLNEHSALFGHDAGVLASARVQRDYVTPHNGLRTTVWEQTLDNIPVFEGLLVGHVTQDGELVNLSSHFVPDPARAADAGTPNRGFLVGNPAISVPRAIRLAAANVNVIVEESQVTVSGSPQGAELRQTATAAGLFGPAQAQLVWLPMNRDAMRLCWRVILGNRSTLELFLVLVDAETGEVMVRHGLTAHIQPATYNVYTNDSPSPFSPGYATPSSIQPSNVVRTNVTLSALSTNASPAGWVPDGINPPTSGNNVEAFLWRQAEFDGSGNPSPDVPLPRAGGGTNRTFNFPLNLNQDPSSYGSASTVQIFYRANWYHDRLYQMGFTEAAGNFQVTNFNRGGFGNDNVIALVQAEANLGVSDNAFFSTPPDGFNGLCVMFVWDGASIQRDGDLDSEVVCHELTHGLSNRLLGGGVGISQLQTEGMGEGWSDFFALALLSESTDDPNGNYAMGGYVTYFPLANFTENYYYGIRRYPYTTDTNKNPLTFKDIDPTKASPHPGVLQNPFFGGGDPSEPHNSGEVWCATLHEMWANFVLKSGWTVGNQQAMQVVVDGLKLAPANATFLEARDGIVTADLLDTGGDNYVEIWAAFAKRGMGYSAICPPSDTTIGVTEAFDLPPDIGVPDGILEVKVTPPSGEAMFAGETNIILVRVSDSFPITNATVTGTITGGTNLVFRNDGVAPDQVASNSVSSASLKVPTNQPSVTITLVVSAPGKDTSTNVVTYVIVPLPPNDNFTNATKVPVSGTNYFTSNKRATLEPNEPVHANISSETASLWWNYTPSVNTNVLVDTGSSGFRTVVAVYTNQTLATLQPVASAAGTIARPGAYVQFSAQAGRTYHIAIAGYDVKNVGTLSLTIAPGVQPDTNAPTVTITSPLNGQVVTTNRIFLTGSAVDPSPNPSGIKDIIVRVIPVAGAASTTVLPPSLSGPISTNWSTIVGLLPGINDVQVSVSDYAGNISAPVSIQVTYRVLDPVNDFFVNAIVLTGTDGTNSVNTVNATKEAGEPNHAGNLGGKSAWWFYTPPANGILTLSTIFSSYDTVLAVYTGPDVSHLTPIASNDDAYDGVPGGYSQIVQAVNTNQAYRIAVDGYDGVGGLVFLTYSFTTGTVFHVTVNSTTGGIVAPTSADVQSNGTLIVTATPNANYQFDMWDGAVLSLNNPLSLTVNTNMTLTGHFIPVGFTDGFESGDLRHINWTTNGAAVGAKAWFVQTNVVFVGQFAARSGIITHNQTSSLLLTGNFFAADGSFDYRVSSELNFDTLKFLVDGVQQQQWSGDVPWANHLFPLTAGTHTLEWRYSKDASGTAGLDAAFLDDVNLPLLVGTNGASAATLQIQRQMDGTFFIDLTGQTNQLYVLQGSTNLFNWRNISTNIATSGFLRIADPSSSSNQIQFYRAVAAPQ